MSRKSPKHSSHGSPHHHHRRLDHRDHNQEENKQQQQLIPGLPNHIAHLILTKIPPSILYSVSISWRKFINSPLFPSFLSLYTLLIPNNIIKNSPNSIPIPKRFLTPISFYSYDRVSCQWQRLPLPGNVRGTKKSQGLKMSITPVTLKRKSLNRSLQSHKLFTYFS